MLECLTLPCFFDSAADMSLVARPLCVYAQWILSAGSTSAETTVDPTTLPRMLRCHLVLLILVTIVMLFEHLVEGVVDVPAFAISAVQLLCASGALAVLNAPRRNAAGLANRRSALLGCFQHASNVCLIVDVVFSAVCVVGGHTENVVSVDLAVKVALFLFVTSLPFFALDRELAVGRSELTFVWKIWTIEAVDFCTILYGAIDYAQQERSDGEKDLDAWNREHAIPAGEPPVNWDWDDFWLDWSPALQVYVAAFALNAVLFGCLASWILVRALTKADDEPTVERGGYMFVATYVFILDAFTDLPVWLGAAKRVIRRRCDARVPRARVPGNTSMRRERFERRSLVRESAETSGNRPRWEPFDVGNVAPSCRPGVARVARHARLRPQHLPHLQRHRQPPRARPRRLHLPRRLPPAAGQPVRRRAGDAADALRRRRRGRLQPGPAAAAGPARAPGGAMIFTLSPFQNARRAACSVAPTGALSPEFEPLACYPGLPRGRGPQRRRASAARARVARRRAHQLRAVAVYLS